MERQDRYVWTTKKEKAYLKGLGSWAGETRLNTKERTIQLLQNYLVSPRSNWGNADPVSCRMYAEELLKEIT